MIAPPAELGVAETKLDHPAWALAVKRLLDIAVSLIGLACIWPLIALIALAVKYSGPGPVFYRGLRSGLLGRTFRIIKFRTMVVNAESLGGPTTGTNDARVTEAGKFLRRTKLDELPQLWHVLKGEMSLVGPRPEVVAYTDLYTGPEKAILFMRPGITDYASIKFADLDDLVGSEDPDRFFREHIMPEKTRLRLKYVTEWSLKSDFKIISSTTARIFKRVIRG